MIIRKKYPKSSTRLSSNPGELCSKSQDSITELSMLVMHRPKSGIELYNITISHYAVCLLARATCIPQYETGFVADAGRFMNKTSSSPLIIQFRKRRSPGLVRNGKATPNPPRVTTNAAIYPISYRVCDPAQQIARIYADTSANCIYNSDLLVTFDP